MNRAESARCFLTLVGVLGSCVLRSDRANPNSAQPGGAAPALAAINMSPDSEPPGSFRSGATDSGKAAERGEAEPAEAGTGRISKHIQRRDPIQEDGSRSSQRHGTPTREWTLSFNAYLCSYEFDVSCAASRWQELSAVHMCSATTIDDSVVRNVSSHFLTELSSVPLGGVVATASHFPGTQCVEREYQPSEVLGPPYYEDVAYCFGHQIVTRDYWGVPKAELRVSVQVTVAIAMNPAGPYREPTPQELSAYERAIRTAYVKAIAGACGAVGGTLAHEACCLGGCCG
jgi:hypothetical protein